MLHRKIQVSGSRVLVLGLTFKENCPDLRNTRVIDIVNELQGYNVQVDVTDPWADITEAREEYGIDLVSSPGRSTYDAVVIAVAHHQFREVGAAGLRTFCKPDGILYDVKYLLPAADADSRL
jgi:UDP-N-acetyl-D-galactosamine dehydrogenase